jgi:hypothetical protein
LEGGCLKKAPVYLKVSWALHDMFTFVQQKKIQINLP